MKQRTGAEVREIYLDWFEQRGHKRLPSDSLVPSNDPTLLFTGAGMNQFKDYFLGKGAIPHRRVTTAQKCMRMPDLENVGLTSGHHTFFEMLGNFSFGDYFKEDCIPWVFGFYTEGLGIPRERMVVTIYSDDDEAFHVWRDKVLVPEERIYRFGEKENFWPAEAPSKGPNGPCGPCSEIYYDYEYEKPLPANEGLHELPSERFSEIGNCVFTQFDRQDGGKLLPLPQKNIDVGLGLERTTAVVQGVKTNFETDLFWPYIDFVAKRAGIRYGEDASHDVQLRRIADHARAVSFCIADGVLPSNEGRGYILRKILRRACRSAYEIALTDPFLSELSGVVIEQMSAAYPELESARKQMQALILQEEQSFRQIYVAGVQRFESWFESLGVKEGSSWPDSWPRVEVDERGFLPAPPGSGEAVFVLHDTHGFPADISRALLLDRGLAIDEDGFQSAMEAQRERAREGSSLSGAVFTEGFVQALKAAKLPSSVFTGYDEDSSEAQLLAIAIGEERVAKLTANAEAVSCTLVLDRTPFYAESGGQAGDRGRFSSAASPASSPAAGTVAGRILDCQKQAGYFLHKAELLEGSLEEGQKLTLTVDSEARRATESNHTATHLLHQALKDVLGDHVAQAGSLVAFDRLRFDFTHSEKLSPEQIRAIEDKVNREIRRAQDVSPKEMQLSEAKEAGFVALFGEKYGDRVRTLSIGDYSKELCGGTHARNTGQIGLFRILSESSVAAGVRRIEASTGARALQFVQEESQRIDGLAAQLKAPRDELSTRLDQVQKELRRLKKELDAAKKQGRGDALEELEATVRTVGDSVFLAAHVEGVGQDGLLDLLDRLRKKHPSFAGALFGSQGGVPVALAVTKDLQGRGLAAGKMIRELCQLLGGGGGGRPDLAQGKGKDAARVPEAVAKAWELFQAAEPGLSPAS